MAVEDGHKGVDLSYYIQPGLYGRYRIYQPIPLELRKNGPSVTLEFLYPEVTLRGRKFQLEREVTAKDEELAIAQMTSILLADFTWAQFHSYNDHQRYDPLIAAVRETSSSSIRFENG